MSEFLTKMDCTPVEESDKLWILNKPLIFQSDILGKITAPAGFYTDFASVPRIPIFFLLYGGRAHYEGIIHDLLYRRDTADYIEFKEGIDKRVSFSQANRVFFEAMKARHKSFAVTYGMTAGVYLGGWFSFHKRNVMDRWEP